jgi:Mor family transcriptional regulator
MPDVLSSLIRECADLLQGAGIEFRPHQQSTVESRLREMFGGDRVYIGKTSADAVRHKSTRDRLIVRDWQHGEHIPVLVRRYGLSERRVYEILQLHGVRDSAEVCLTDRSQAKDDANNEPIRDVAGPILGRRHAR